MKKLLISLLAIISFFVASAYDFSAKNSDGVTIYYNLSSSTKTATVTYKNSDWRSYSGDVVIPKNITYNGNTYTVKTIGENAFRQSFNLTSVTIPTSVTKISDYAFYWCADLESINIPNTVTSIGAETFCMCYALTSINIPNSVTSIGAGAFSWCTGLTSFTIPSSITSIEERTFDACENMTSVSIPNSVTDIGEKAFSWCFSLTSVNIPNSVTSIGDYAFCFCKNLTSITLPDSITYLGEYVFSYCYSLPSIILPNSLSHINIGLFEKCESLTSVTIPNSIEYILFDSFEGCIRLKSIEIPNSVLIIYSNAFSSCESLISIIIPNSVRSINDETFSNCKNLKSIIIGSGIKDLNSTIFDGCPNLYKVVLLPETPPSNLKLPDLPDRITYVPNDSYNDNNSLGTIKKYEYLSSYFDVDGIRYVPSSPADKTCAAIDCIYDSDIEEVNIGETISYRGVEMKVVELNPYTLYNNDNIKNLQISSKVSIGDNFAKYSNLQNLKLSNIGEIGAEAFCGCSYLKEATIGNEVTSIGNYAFYGCSSLKETTMGNEVTSIGDYAFSGCTSLETLWYGPKVKAIGEEAFSKCSVLTKLYSSPSTPPTCATKALYDINKWDCTVYVPQSAIDSYKSADQWKDFFFVESYDFPAGIDTVLIDEAASQTYRVYDLNGILKKITTDKSDLHSLPSGLYIINGKKTYIP